MVWPVQRHLWQTADGIHASGEIGGRGTRSATALASRNGGRGTASQVSPAPHLSASESGGECTKKCEENKMPSMDNLGSKGVLNGFFLSFYRRSEMYALKSREIVMIVNTCGTCDPGFMVRSCTCVKCDDHHFR